MKKIQSTNEPLIFTKTEALNLALGFRVYADNCFTDQEQLSYYKVAHELECLYLPKSFQRPALSGLFVAKLDRFGNTVFQETNNALICKINQVIDLFNYVSNINENEN